jgi:hypothetical protein
MDMRFGTWNIWSSYRVGFLMIVSRELSIIIIFICINPVQSRMWKSQYKYKVSSTDYDVNIVIEASKYIKQGNII